MLRHPFGVGAPLAAWLAIGVVVEPIRGERHERGSPAERGFGGMPGGSAAGPGGAGHFAGYAVAAERLPWRTWICRRAASAIHNGAD